MATQLGDQDQTRLALASLFAALVQTLGERDEAFVPEFDRRLERIYREMEDYESNPIGALQTLRWTHELIRSQETPGA
jgi:hypothetical protein